MNEKRTANIGKEYKTKLTQDEIARKLQAGESVKAIDVLSSMGIKVIQF